MATFTSKASGTWDAEGATTWNEAGHPIAGDAVTIQAGHTVTLSSATACASLDIEATGALTDASGNYGLTVSGVTTVYGTLTCGTADMSFASGVTSGVGLELRAGSVFVGGSGNHTIGSVRFFGTVTLTSGVTTINAVSNSTYATAVTWYDSCTFSHGNGTMTFTRTSNQRLSSLNNTARSLYNLVVNNASCYFQFHDSLGFTLTIENDFTITAGTFNASEDTTGTPRNLVITGNLSNSGTFIPSQGTVTLNGTTQSITGSWNFYNFTKSVAAADSLTFDNTGVYTFAGAVTLAGASSQLLSLISDSVGNAFSFTMSVGATKTSLTYLSVKDSDASGSDASLKPIDPTNSVDVSGNTSWFTYIPPVPTVFGKGGFKSKRIIQGGLE